MPNACNYSWSNELDAIIRREALAADAPLDLAYTFIAFESGFNALARNLNPPLEDSVGLLQLNRLGGQGQGFTVEQLQDPVLNLRVGLPPIARTYAAVWSPTLAAFEFVYLVATGSGHPGLISRSDPRIRRAFNIWVCFNTGVGWAGPGGAPSTETIPGAGGTFASSMAGHTTLFMFPGGIIGRMMQMVMPQRMVGGVLRSLSPGGFQRRLLGSFHPRSMLPGGSGFGLARPRVRLPPGHAEPRRRPRR